MTCSDRDWKTLVAHRYAGGEPPVEWASALSHLDDCAGCRQAALEYDPTLLFHRLGGVDRAPGSTAGPRIDTDELRLSLSALRRTRALTAAAGTRGSRAARAAAALLLAVAALLLGGTPAASPPGHSPKPPVTTTGLDRSWIPQSEIAAPPFVEAVGRPGARIYQLGGDDLSLVMIVDENLDV